VEESQAGRVLGLDELLLLNALWQERSLTTQKASRLLQKPEPDARTVLEQLVEAGLVEARGERKGRTYHLSAVTYRRLGVPSAYVRRRGFEPIQQEQMVLQYIDRFGSISRREVAKLCHLGSMQAYRLLKRLEREDKIQRSVLRKLSDMYERANNRSRSIPNCSRTKNSLHHPTKKAPGMRSARKYERRSRRYVRAQKYARCALSRAKPTRANRVSCFQITARGYIIASRIRKHSMESCCVGICPKAKWRSPRSRLAVKRGGGS